MGLSGREREIVTALIETKAVDFEAIGKVLAKFGPTMALDMDYEDGFCGTMRYFTRVYTGPFPPRVDTPDQSVS
jgi:hypothetical protein